jgi:phosphatidyl-myo-inositol alpha-mannosyltransferase
MKIALVSPYDFAYPGGVVNHIVCLERYLTRLGHDVRVIAPASQKVYFDGDRFILIGTPRAVPASGSICRVTLSVWLENNVRKVLKENRFDVVHLHEPLMPMLCTTVLRLSDAANVGTFHAHAGRPGYLFPYPVSSWLLKRWWQHLHQRIAVSEPAREFVNGYLPADYTLIPNGVDLEHFDANVAPFEEYRDGKINILFVGRLEKRKGLDYLLRAMEILQRQRDDLRLIVVGPGTRLMGGYQKYVRQHGLKDVIFTGCAEYADLPRYYQTADIFCTPATRCESFGIILLEAMAMGKPIVASRNEGYRRVLEDGAEGYLVPPKDAAALADALGKLAADPDLRREMGRRGQSKAAGYSWAKVSEQVAEVYQRAIETRAASKGGRN